MRRRPVSEIHVDCGESCSVSWSSEGHSASPQAKERLLNQQFMRRVGIVNFTTDNLGQLEQLLVVASVVTGNATSWYPF